MQTKRALRRAVLSLALGVMVWPIIAPASIEEQRTRLPAPPDPAACADRVSGVWRGHAYYPRQREWGLFTLTIRAQGEALTGDMSIRWWHGEPNNPNLLPCTEGHLDYTVREPATGTVRNGREIDFLATSWTVSERHCASGRGGIGYIVDHFVGTVDDAQEFQSVNRYNSGGGMVEDVTLFRRVSCETAAQAARPQVVIVPPSQPMVIPSARPRRKLFGCGG